MSSVISVTNLCRYHNSCMHLVGSIYVASDADNEGVTVNQNVINNTYVYIQL